MSQTRGLHTKEMVKETVTDKLQTTLERKTGNSDESCQYNTTQLRLDERKRHAKPKQTKNYKPVANAYFTLAGHVT